MIHVTNGDCAVQVLQQAVRGEFLPWRDWQRTLAALAAGFALLAGLAFALAR